MTLDPNLKPHPIPPAALEWDIDRQLYVEVESPACGDQVTVKGRTFTCDDLPGHEHAHRQLMERTMFGRRLSWCGAPWDCGAPCTNVSLQLRVLDDA
jgi:hypothetical protein